MVTLRFMAAFRLKSIVNKRILLRHCSFQAALFYWGRGGIPIIKVRFFNDVPATSERGCRNNTVIRPCDFFKNSTRIHFTFCHICLQTARMNRDNADISTQLQYLRDQSRQDPRLSDLQRKLDNLERDKEATQEKLSSFRGESERKDSLIERMTSQIRELTAHVDKAESDKRRYHVELEDSMKKLREYKINEEDIKNLLREKDEELRESEDKRTELKNRALEAIKE